MYIIHKPVLVAEVIKYLDPQTGHNYLDGTLGAGGHARAVLEATNPNGRLLGIDADQEALEFCREQLASYGDRVVLVKDNFVNLLEIARQNDFYPVRGILLDLGVSWHQLTTPERGFSFQKTGRLDMRLDQGTGVDALAVVNDFDRQELIDVFRKFGEVSEAVRLTNKIIVKRSKQPITTTKELREIIDSIVPRKNQSAQTKLAAKVFQALRIQVNNELGNLAQVLEPALKTLAKDGRLVVISYHSLEDRLVKRFFQEKASDCICPPEFFKCQCDQVASLKILTKKVVTPGTRELKNNPKSRSAKLRAVVKL